MNAPRARIAVLSLVAVLAATALAACGSTSSNSSTAAAAASGSGTRTTGRGPDSAARAKLAACLKQHGVTLPQRRSGARPPGGGYGGGGGPRFFGGGGGADGRFSNPKTRTAFQACAKAAGLNFRGGQAGRFRPSATAIAKFASCVKQHGYTLPKANMSGKGAVYPRAIETDKKFQTAARACQSLLRPSGAPPPGAGSTTTATTKT